MISTPRSLLGFFHAHVTGGVPLALATVVGTEGSTYRKPGAQMLLAADGSSMGLLSGGCLETDLAERARRVLETGTAEIVTYDARSSNDPIWGLGLGCEGAMRILLTRIDAANGYQPFAFVAGRLARPATGATALVLESSDLRYPLGYAWHSDSTSGDVRVGHLIERCRAKASEGGFETLFVSSADLRLTAFITAIDLPARLLLCGAGPDAQPVAEIANLLGWQVTVADHRPAYMRPGRFPPATELVELPADSPSSALQLDRFDAAVVMSHNLESDARYLRALAGSSVPYVGLLGPAARRRRLMADLGPQAVELGRRLFGPVGLDIGASTPETIAVAIIGEIQAFLTGRPGESFRNRVQDRRPAGD